jgi:CDP-6-deoxy-D-xylo-4-hexulose-3-dehydrase
MSTIEGGAVVTDNPKLAQMLRLVRAHGWDRNLSFSDQQEIRKKHKVNSTFYSRYTFYDLGYNFRPNEIAGFLGVKQITYADEVVRAREKNFKKIAQAIFSRTDKYYPLTYDHIDVVSNFAVPVICKTKEIRDELVKKCDGRVEIRPVVGGDMTRQPFFKKYAKKFPSTIKGSNAGFIHGHGLYFGNNPELTKKEIDEIIKIFAK